MRSHVYGIALALGLTGTAPALNAQGYPAKPVRMVVSTAAGGSADFIARLVAGKMSASLGQQVVVENRAGSGGVVGTDAVAKATPDGYTLLMAYGSHVINPSLYPKLPYDTQKDFAAISQIALQPLLLSTHPALPVRTVKDLISLAKAQPGKLNFASAGAGSGGHLANEIFNQMAGIKMVHVPYRGSSPALVDLIAGQTQVYIASLITLLPQVRNGKIRGLAVTSATRSAVMPEIPAIAETLRGYEVVNSYYLLAPAGTPADVIAKLHAETVKAVRQPDVVERLAKDGADPVGNTPPEAAQYIATEIVKWGRAVKDSGAKPE
ncbi:MAG: tripartite tricarboxylate transporter substrate binding protein [Burkholderiales bacterium]